MPKTNDPPDLWDAIQKFRAEHDLADLNVEEVFADVRDRTSSREVGNGDDFAGVERLRIENWRR